MPTGPHLRDALSAKVLLHRSVADPFAIFTCFPTQWRTVRPASMPYSDARCAVIPCSVALWVPSPRTDAIVLTIPICSLLVGACCHIVLYYLLLMLSLTGLHALLPLGVCHLVVPILLARLRLVVCFDPDMAWLPPVQFGLFGSEEVSRQSWHWIGCLDISCCIVFLLGISYSIF